jgi:3-(3-hydroxy-phenyl)propionate hydroxylase
MRPAGKGELESLYFDYPHFDFHRPPEMDGKPVRHRVVIAGAGPVGLTAAIELARRGIGCVVLDSKATLNDGSRAICISRHSLETLQQLGVAEPFVDKALGWTHGRSYYRNRMIYRLEMPHSVEERFYPMYNLQQQYVEKFLAERCGEFPELIELRWQNEVVDATQSEEGVELTVSTPDGEYPLQARYMLAADGGKSSVRKFLGLRLAGDNLPGDYVIADIRMEHDFPTERRCFFEPDAIPEATLLVHRQPDDIWRIDYQLPSHEDAVEATREDNIRKRVQDILNMIGHNGEWELEWWSIYTANTLCLDEYRHGRVMFIGDAAHIVPIFGVRGLNNGISDAVNAAWKLAYVLDGRAPDSLLDSYTPERRGATLDVFRNAGKSSRFMTPPTRGYELMRKAVLELSLSQEFTQPFANPRQVTPYIYDDSPLTTPDDPMFTAGPSAGAPAINTKIGDDNFLLDHLGPGFTGIYFSDGELSLAILELTEQLRGIDKGFTLLTISRLPLRQNNISTLIDADGNIFNGYGARSGSFYLLRPDRHVSGRWLTVDPDDIIKAMHRSLSAEAS